MATKLVLDFPTFQSAVEDLSRLQPHSLLKEDVQAIEKGVELIWASQTDEDAVQVLLNEVFQNALVITVSKETVHAIRKVAGFDPIPHCEAKAL